MSMIGNLRRTTDARLDALLADPESIVAYLYPEEAEEDAKEEQTEAFADLEIDKSWHGIHFLLTGTAWEGDAPLNFIATGGEEVGDVDLGYGPARVFKSAEVKAIAAALAPLTAEVLKKRFDPSLMTRLEIYPTIWDRPHEADDNLEYLLESYEQLRAFVAGAAENDEGLIVFMN
jgi:Domain of unknown function (DUF1877)